MSSPLINKILIGQKAIKELGISRVINFGLYKLLFKSRYYQFRCPAKQTARPSPDWFTSLPNTFDYYPFSIPTKINLEKCIGNKKADLILAADEIVAGNWQFYGEMLQPLNFTPLQGDKHWSLIQDRPETDTDLKDTWESSRFCWVYPLGRAYILTGDERYPKAFLDFYTQFTNNNPINLGENWMSAQEVALRIIAFAFAIQVFRGSPNFPEVVNNNILQSIYLHATRIPPTISYSRAQNNNHLISEAAGLIIAGVVLRGIKQADRFWKMGWLLFNEGIKNQIDGDGTYMQQSANYHRMVLHLAMLVFQVARKAGDTVPQPVLNKLQLATQWLFGIVDEISGFTPNLGHNDGSNILLLAPLSFRDFRPTLQSAGLCFLNQAVYNPGVWDELSLWLGLLPNDHLNESFQINVPSKFRNPSTRLGSSHSWGCLRAVHFRDRPSHADQLHVDLWWHGHNIAMDAGTYRYSAPKPWNNSLAGTPIHNTITINDTNQMVRAGRFLWLDWAQARIIRTQAQGTQTLKAEHDGYNKLGITHRRELSAPGDSKWIIRDEILRKSGGEKTIWISLHWLIPDGNWNHNDGTLVLDNEDYKIKLSVEVFDDRNQKMQTSDQDFQIIRCGEVLFGKKELHPNFGWYSPTYGCKISAISFRYTLQTSSEISLISRWEIFDPDSYPYKMG